MSSLPDPLVECWYLALHSHYGVVLQVEGDPVAVTNKLYVLRRKLNDPELNSLMLIRSPQDTTQLWLVKKDEAEVGSTTPAEHP